MCTLILAWRAFAETPIVVAANREESTDRPSRPPAAFGERPRIVAPRDERADGTWIGFNEGSVFVAVTNRRADLEGERSRGLLVLDALSRETGADAIAKVERELRRRSYAGFNLVIADGECATLLEWDGTLRKSALDPGVHVVVNEGFGVASEKATRIGSALPPVEDVAEESRSVATPDEWLDAVADVLRDHEIEACVHGDGHGTRSSSLLWIAEDGRSRYRFADGPPCRTSYESVWENDG